MFLQLSVSHSVHGGGVLPQCMLGHPPGADTPPKQTATVAGGTHPTGMHSGLNYSLSMTLKQILITVFTNPEL